jgi:16S rRNA (cytidine1402-2'-O)-methyltransferase
MSGILYIVATPIGNLGDMTLRGIETLKTVDIIYAEDTRVTRKLLDRFEIAGKLRSYREAASRYDVEKTIKEVLDLLAEGKDVAYTSDAGTPSVSDPGDYLVKQVGGAGFTVVPVPGASALAALLSVAGLGVQHPLFVGFLPKKKGHQTYMRHLQEALSNGVTDGLVFYESPERIVKLLEELSAWGMELQVCLGRELTKQFEEILRGPLPDILQNLTERKSIKGEIVLLVTQASSLLQ